MMIDRYALAMLALSGLMGGVCGGCADPTQQRSMQFDEAQKAYDQKQYALATKKLTAYIESTDANTDLGKPLYLRGLSQVGAGHRPEAYADLQRCVQNTQDADTRWRGEMVLGTLYFEDGNWEYARRSYVAAADAAPKSPPLDMVLMRQALCEERLGRWTDALATFQKLLTIFQKGPAADTARRHLELRPTFFSVQCGAYGRPENAEKQRFDLKKRGFESFVNRETRGQADMFVVLVGRFGNYHDAEAALARLKPLAPTAVIWP